MQKNDIWGEITDAINSLGVEVRTVQEVQNKWKNMTSQAKLEYAGICKEIRKTGGGPAPKMPNSTTAIIIDIFKDRPSFNGLVGFESLPGKWRLFSG